VFCYFSAAQDTVAVLETDCSGATTIRDETIMRGEKKRGSDSAAGFRGEESKHHVLAVS
jgi:hypothetical protein